ncbi:DUF2208 domain-containing protein [Sulfolobus sp. SCGC AB-777_G06]|jgi:uncharacterized membrane protein|nr:DUF2208 domain-containing protein [Sulfolobus sp. SCGC AB-777_G06]
MSGYPQGYPNPYNWKMILISQGLMILMSFVLSLYPQYFLPVYILYIVVIMGISSVMMAKSNPMLAERKYMGEIYKSNTLFEEKNAGSLIQKDMEYVQKMQQLAVANFKSFGIMILYIIIIFLFYDYILLKIVDSVTQYEKLAIYLIYFEALYLFNMFVYRRLIKIQMMDAMAPSSYKVTEKGILSTDKSGVFLHSRHLVNAEIIENREKKYVEIDSKTSKLPYKIRLYTNDIDRLLEVLNRVKRMELKRQQTSNS